MKILKLSDKFKDYKIVLVTRPDFAELIKDSTDFIDDIIVGLIWKKREKRRVLKKLLKYNAEVIIYSEYSILPNDKKIMPLVKFILENVPAKYVYGPGYLKNTTDGKLITNFVEEKPELEFLTDIYKDYFEKIADTKIDITCSKIKQLIDFNKKYVLFAPFSAAKDRTIKTDFCAELINYINEKYHYEVVITGSANVSEINYAEEIISMVNNKNMCHNLVSQINITLLPSFYSFAQLIIAAESGSVHIAMNTENLSTPIICLSTGRAYIAFHPYPENPKNLTYIYPDKVNQMINEGFANELITGSPCCLSEISPVKVKEAIDNYLAIKL